jgi:hypothetical protein
MGMSKEDILKGKIARLERETISILQRGGTTGILWRKIEIDRLTKELLNLHSPLYSYDLILHLN